MSDVRGFCAATSSTALPNHLSIVNDFDDECEELMTSYSTFTNIDIYKEQDKKNKFCLAMALDDKYPIAATLLFTFETSKGEGTGVCLPYMATRFGFRGFGLGELLLRRLKAALWEQGISEVYVPATSSASGFWKRNHATPVATKFCDPKIIEHCCVFNGTTLLVLKTNSGSTVNSLNFEVCGNLDTMLRLYAVSKRFHALSTEDYKTCLKIVKGKNVAFDKVKGWTLLFEAVQRSSSKEAFNLCLHLLNDGADPNQVEDSFRQTPIFFAANKGHIDVIRLLIERKADPMRRDRNHQVALYYAAKNNHLTAVKYFVKECKIYAYISDYLRRTPLTYAFEENKDGSHDAVIKFLQCNANTGAISPPLRNYYQPMPPGCLRANGNQRIRKKVVEDDPATPPTSEGSPSTFDDDDSFSSDDEPVRKRGRKGKSALSARTKSARTSSARASSAKGTSAGPGRPRKKIQENWSDDDVEYIPVPPSRRRKTKTKTK